MSEADSKSIRSTSIFAQLQREMQEYRNSLLLTPAVVGGLLVLAILLSVLLANRLAFIGEGAMEVLVSEHSTGGSGLNITISIDENADSETTITRDFIVVEEEAEVDDEEWNFSREWNFRPPQREGSDTPLNEDISTLNPAMNALHALFQIILLFVTVNYLLSCLYQDRKDRSILFWKSLPVSEWQEVLCKFVVASFIAPLAYFAVSIVTQLLTLVLAMLMVWRLDAGSPFLVLENIQFVSLFGNQLGGYFIWALWTAPVFAWFLVASALAKRSPFMLGFGVPIALIFIEKVFLGTDHLAMFVAQHVPRIANEDAHSMGIYMYGPAWASLDYMGMLIGLLVSAPLVYAAVWLRQHRFEV